MSKILLVSKGSASLADLADELIKRKEFDVMQVKSGEEALSLVRENRADVVIAAEVLSDGLALPFVQELMRKHPLINCAMISSLPPEDFHELTEGLGLFMQLPINPGAEEADKMVQFLDSISALMGT
jgi:DNA-binding response OmpR family regulator